MNFLFCQILGRFVVLGLRLHMKMWLHKGLNQQASQALHVLLHWAHLFLCVLELQWMKQLLFNFHWFTDMTNSEKAKMFDTSTKAVNPLYYLLLELKALCWKLLSHLIHELFAKDCEQSVLCRALRQCLARSLIVSAAGWSFLKWILAYKWTSGTNLWS